MDPIEQKKDIQKTDTVPLPDSKPSTGKGLQHWQQLLYRHGIKIIAYVKLIGIHLPELRAAQQFAYSILCRSPRSEGVQIVGKQGEWFRVRRIETVQTGWVHRKYLRLQ